MVVTMVKRRPLLFIVALGAVLRVYALARHSLWFDEGATLYNLQFVNLSLEFLQGKLSMEPPLLPIVARLWIFLVQGLAGFEPGTYAADFAMRLAPAAAGVACIPLVFAVTRSLCRARTPALWAAFIFAISPFQIYYAQEFRVYTLYTALLFGAFYFALKALDENRARQWAGLALCLGLSVYANYTSMWNIALLSLYFLVNIRMYSKRLVPWFLCHLSVLALIAPLAFLVSRSTRTFAQAQEHWFPAPDWRTPLITLKNFFAGYAPWPLVYWPLFLVCGALMALGFWRFRRDARAFTFFAIFVVAYVGGFALFWRLQDFSYYTHRLMIVAGGAASMLAATGIDSIRFRALRWTAAALVAALTLPCLASVYRDESHPSWRHRLGVRHKPDFRGASGYIRSHFRAGDAVTHANHFSMLPFIQYYWKGKQSHLGFTREDYEGLLRSFHNEEMWERTGLVPVRVEDAVGPAERIWYVEASWERGEPSLVTRELRAWLDGHYLRARRASFKDVTVYLYLNRPALTPGIEIATVYDDGDETIPFYVFPDTPEGRAVRAEWLPAFLECMPDYARIQPKGFTAHFQPTFGSGGRFVYRGEITVVAFADTDNDGVADAISVPELGAPLGEEESLDHPYGDQTLLAIDPATQSGFMAFTPLWAEDRFRYYAVLSNPTPVTREIECVVYEPATVIGALSFQRLNPGSEVWRPCHQYNPAPPPQPINEPAIAARLGRHPGPPALLAKELNLAPDIYSLYARFLQTGDSVNVGRATLTFGITAPGETDPAALGTSVGVIDGNTPGAAFGWTWARVGGFFAPAPGGQLRIEASNPDGLEQAVFDLDRLLIVEGEHPVSEPPAAMRFTVGLGPGEERGYVLEGRLEGRDHVRIEMEFTDTTEKQIRRLSFFVRQRT